MGTSTQGKNDWKTLENLVREVREGELTREKTVKVKEFLTDLAKAAAGQESMLDGEDALIREARARLEAEHAEADDRNAVAKPVGRTSGQDGEDGTGSKTGSRPPREAAAWNSNAATKPNGRPGGSPIEPGTEVLAGEKDKLGIVDVKLNTASGEVLHIDVQVNPDRNFISRSLYYNDRLVVDQVGAGERYKAIRRSISIMIVNFTLLKDEAPDRYKNVYRFLNTVSHEPFTDLQELVILELPKVPDEDDGTELWPWLKFFKCSNDGGA
jgi:hypothetical protein